MTGLVDRCARVTARLIRPSVGGIIGTFFDLLPNAIVVEFMRIQFQIQKQLGKDPNTCDITLTNLSDHSRAVLQQSNVHITLEAGYDGEFRHLFSGDILHASSRHIGTEWETVMQLGDGDKAFRQARVNRSYAPGVTVRAVLTEAARSLGLELPRALTASTELDNQFANGFAMSGWTRDELTRLLAPYGYGWSIQDGRLQILRDEDVCAGSAHPVSGAKGMIGTPALGSPFNSSGKTDKKKGGKPQLSVSTLLYPQITPGGLIALESRTLNGIYRVSSVTHSGDTEGGDWTTEIEAKPQ